MLIKEWLKKVRIRFLARIWKVGIQNFEWGLKVSLSYCVTMWTRTGWRKQANELEQWWESFVITLNKWVYLVTHVV